MQLRLVTRSPYSGRRDDFLQGVPGLGVRASWEWDGFEHVDRCGVVPRLASHHVGDVDVSAFEFADCCVDEPVVLALSVEGLGIDEHNAYLAGFEVAARMQGGDELLVVHVAVAEVPPDRGTADPFAVHQHVASLVVSGHGTVGEAEHGSAVAVEAAERIPHVKVHLGGSGLP